MPSIASYLIIKPLSGGLVIFLAILYLIVNLMVLFNEKDVFLVKNYTQYLPQVLAVAKTAADSIADIFHTKNYTTNIKSDNSPVTEADLRAHQIIERELLKIDPSLPVLSEESSMVPYHERSQWPKYWLVDPLDGTKEFIRGTNDFTVNIALIEDHNPVLGVVVAPMLKQYYWGLKGGQAFFQEGDLGDKGDKEPIVIQVNQTLRTPIKVAVSRYHHQKSKVWKSFIEKLGPYELIQCGSALKICLVARGEADLYPRFGETGEWDTAAGHCILEAAGGKLVDLAGNTLKYNTKPTIINPSFLAIGSIELINICCG